MFFFRTVICISLLGLSACWHNTDTPAYKWQTFIYLDADNDLAPAALFDLEEMTQGNTGSSTNILVQLDLPNGEPAKRFQIINGKKAELENLGEVDMTQAQTLTDFLLWAKAQSRAEQTMLILSDHGNGWDQLTGPSPQKSRPRSLFVDTDNGKNRVSLHNHAAREAIANAQLTIDILGFDASIMGTLEAIYEFSDFADIVITSQEVGWKDGWDYKAIFSALNSSATTSADDLAKTIVNAYGDYLENVLYPQNVEASDQRFTIAAHHSSKIKPIVNAVDQWAQSIRDNLINQKQITLETLGSSRAAAQPIDCYAQYNVYVDLADFAVIADANSAIPALITDATIAEYHGKNRPKAHGMSIVFYKAPGWTNNTYQCGTNSAWYQNPGDTKWLALTYDANYKNYDAITGSGNKGQFINETQWDEMLNDFYKAVEPTLVD